MDGGRNSTPEESASNVEQEVGRVVEEAKQLQESAASHIHTSSNDEQSLRQRANSVDSSIHRCRSRLHSLVSRRLIDAKLSDKLEEELQRAKCLISDGEAAAFLPSKGHGRFLRMFLGPINVQASRKDVQLKVKEEYNSYRDRTALLFLLFPSALLIMRSWVWDGCLPAFPVQLYQSWLLFLYTGLALRENILRVNGSDIRPWWIYHHYCAMIMALVSLTWEIKGQPNCAQKQVPKRGRTLLAMGYDARSRNAFTEQIPATETLHSNCIGQGIDMPAKRMDVVWGETAGVDGQLWLLAPILFILQGFEAYVGLQLLRTAFARVVTEWQVTVLPFSYNILRNPVGVHGCWEFLKHGTDAVGEIKIQS
ncbi:Transmembrane protein 120 homolog [Linum grandiflorum]